LLAIAVLIVYDPFADPKS